jgi:outer membrane receptor protein involved in Fe transport
VPLGNSGIAGQCTQNLASYGYTAAPLTFGPDSLWSYSVGEKAKLAGGRVTLNADAYWVDWSDVQTRLLLNCSYFFTDNKGKITSRGIEVDSTVRVTPRLTLSGNVSFNDSKADGNIPTVGAFDGNRTPYFPKWIAGVAAYYDRPVGPGVLHAQASYQYRGDQHTTFNPLATVYDVGTGKLTANGPSKTYAVIPESHNVDAALSYTVGRYELGVFGKNLANGVHVTGIGRATYYKAFQAGDRETLARPRTVGARLKVSF